MASSSAPAPSPLLALPAELWLTILEQTTVYDAINLWITVRRVSRAFQDLVERLFLSTYLPKFSISLALPRRDAATGALKWSATPIPGSQVVMSFDRVDADKVTLLLKSPATLRQGSEVVSLAELRDQAVLPLERLKAAPPWVYFNKNALTGLIVNVPPRIEWDEERGVWIWRIDWKRLVSQFYNTKAKLRVRS